MSNDILPASHYVPLHSAKAGLLYSEFRGEDKYTTKESERLLRLPMYYKLTDEDLDEVVMRVKEYYKFT
jgi:dTDP-4-amino-4,6-dideoxygalactose transaminase